MMQHVEFSTFKNNGTYLVFGIYTELKSRTVVLDSASCIVSSRLFQLHQNKKHKLMTFFMLLTLKGLREGGHFDPLRFFLDNSTTS